ncbi:unnamed protein product [Hydatigera taeniaeformis]|uniref:ZP domain-containing protein n=1 Tax=Hydatigena taeniaeformis TaxID=6205 RepID=A0A0R3X217_HYDTA|nr:unnamed protein product [Hydatigera taeniaeformis]
MIFVSCHATDEAKSRDLGEIYYFPDAPYENRNVGYFSTVVFPYLNQADFQSPLVAVAFPAIKKMNLSVTIVCKYLNLDVDDVYKFELISRDTP